MTNAFIGFGKMLVSAWRKVGNSKLKPFFPEAFRNTVLTNES